MPPVPQRVLVIGATGLVGREIVRLLVADDAVGEVVALVRRDPGGPPWAGVSYVVANFDRLDEVADAFRVDAVYSAVGTMRRQTPDPVAYRYVELELPLEVIRRARSAGARKCGLVSSVGASERSLSTYLRQKGELERAVEGLGFEELVIVRPSFLVGNRAEFRFGERLGMVLARLLPGRYRAVRVEEVAKNVVTNRNDYGGSLLGSIITS